MPFVTWASRNGPLPRILRESRAMTSRSAPTSGARSVLLMTSRIGIPIHVEGSTRGRLPRQVETVAYRIAQEALTNIARHARATRVTIRVRREGDLLHYSIRDDGVGFDVENVVSGAGPRGLGLIGMRERLAALDATLHVRSDTNAGTQLSITIPSAAIYADSTHSCR